MFVISITLLGLLYLCAGFVFVILTTDFPYGPRKSRVWDYLSKPLTTAGLWNRPTPEDWTILGESALGHTVFTWLTWPLKLGLNLALLTIIVLPHHLFIGHWAKNQDHPFKGR